MRGPAGARMRAPGPARMRAGHPSWLRRLVLSDVVGASQLEVEQQLEQYRGQLTGYCYRMLGSPFEAEDAVQETMLRAWRGHSGFEGRAALRSWLYQISTNVCLDMIAGR